ncbi:hypothetical protein [Methylocucumis oryzae]|nr:hypothetical protein [Methylocucumis oryzae]
MLDKIRHSSLVADNPPDDDGFDHELAALALPLLDVILGASGFLVPKL